MSSPTRDCSANKKASSPATLQMTELWVYSILHTARLNIFVYSSRYPWHGFHTGEGRTLPGSHPPRDSKKHLASDFRSSLLQRNLYPYPCLPSCPGHCWGLRPTENIESMSTSWSLFINRFLVKYHHLGKQVCQEIISGKNQIHSTLHK